MADEDPAVYDTATARGVLARLARLERKQNALLGGGYNQAAPQGTLVTRWGKTSTTPDYPTYPTSGNVVGVSLGNYEPSPLYPGATATKTFTAYSPPIYVFATLENGSMPAQGTEVRLTWRNGMWWILQEPSSSARCVLVGKLSDGTALNSSNGNDGGENYLVSTGGTVTSTDGMWAFPQWDGEFSNSNGTVFREDTPSVYTDETLNLLENVKYRLTVHTVWRLQPFGQTDAETYLGRNIGGVYVQDLNAITLTAQTSVSLSGSAHVILGQSSIECFYEPGAGTYHRFACHSGVILFDLSSSGSPATLRIRTYRADDYTTFDTIASLYDMQATIEQITDN